MKYIIEKKEDLYENKITRSDSIEFKCIQCGKTCEINSPRRHRFPRYETMLCEDCYRIKKSIETWGTDRPQKSEAVKRITEEHNMDKYGKPYINTFGSKEWCDNMEAKHGPDWRSKIGFGSEKCYETMNERYGANVWVKSKDHDDRLPEIIAKAKETNTERYGVDSYSKTDEFIEKKKQTSMNLYGVEYYQQLPEARERSSELHIMHPEWGAKAAETNRANHGGKHWTQLEENREWLSDYMKSHPEIIQKSLESNRGNHGGLLYTQTEEGRQSQSERMMDHPEWIQKSLENRTDTELHFIEDCFDSISEFCVYMYCYYNGIPITRNYMTYFEYTDVKGFEHKAFPDFYINGQLVEIKGSQFIKPDGSWYLPYRYDYWDDDEYEYKSSIYESKHKCLIKHGVYIISDKDVWVKECCRWVKSMIDVSQYKKNNPNNVSYGYTPFNCDQSVEFQKPTGIGMTPFDAKMREKNETYRNVQRKDDEYT